MAAPSKDKTSPYAAPGGMLRSDMPDGYGPESIAAPVTAGYPMLRVMRWVLRVAAAVYLLVSLAQAANVLGMFDSTGSGRADERAVTYPEGSRGRDDSMQKYLMITLGLAVVQNLVYSLALLALAEGIQLGLDIREQQLRASSAAVGQAADR